MKLNTKKDVQAWLEKQFVENNDYIIHDDLSVDLLADCHIFDDCEVLPVVFNFAKGNFYASDIGLKTLKGFPKWVGKNLDISGNNLLTLEYCSNTIGGYFSASHNELSTLMFFPQSIQGDIFLTHNNLTNLEHLPKEMEGSLSVQYNQLKSLKGCPQKVKNLDCSNNSLTSLEGIAQEIKYLKVNDNQLSHLSGLAVVHSIEANNNHIDDFTHLPDSLVYLHIKDSHDGQTRYISLDGEELEKFKLHHRLQQEMDEKPVKMRKKV